MGFLLSQVDSASITWAQVLVVVALPNSLVLMVLGWLFAQVKSVKLEVRKEAMEAFQKAERGIETIRSDLLILRAERAEMRADILREMPAASIPREELAAKLQVIQATVSALDSRLSDFLTHQRETSRLLSEISSKVSAHEAVLSQHRS